MRSMLGFLALCTAGLVSCVCPETLPPISSAGSGSATEKAGLVLEAALVKPESLTPPSSEWSLTGTAARQRQSSLDYTGLIFTHNLLQQDRVGDLGTWSVPPDGAAFSFRHQQLEVFSTAGVGETTVTVQADGTARRVDVPEGGGAYFEGFKSEPGLVLIVRRRGVLLPQPTAKSDSTPEPRAGTTLDVILVDRDGKLVAEPIDVSWTHWLRPSVTASGGRFFARTHWRRVRGGRLSIVAEASGGEIAFETGTNDRHTARTNLTPCPVCDRQTAFVRVGDQKAHVTIRLVDPDGEPLRKEPLVVVLEAGPAQPLVRSQTDYVAACDRARLVRHDRVLASTRIACPGHARMPERCPPFGTQASIHGFGGLEASSDENGNLTVAVSARLGGRVIVMGSPWHQGLIGRPTPLPSWALSGQSLAVVDYPGLNPGECRDLGAVRVSREPLLVSGEVHVGEQSPPQLYLRPLVQIASKLPGASFWEEVCVPSPHEVTYEVGQIRRFSYHAKPTPEALYRVRAGSGPWVTFVPGDKGVVVRVGAGRKQRRGQHRTSSVR